MDKTVIYAGTFDPITNGHLDIIRRAAQLFSQVIVAVAANPSKQPFLPLAQRVELTQKSCAQFENVKVIGFSGLLADFAQTHKADTLIRGIRSSDDVEYEIQLAQLNRQLAADLDTVFLPPAVEWRYLSSTMVREIYRHQGDIRAFVPQCVWEFLEENNEG